ncbi:MAG TPA: ISKra4 family transposase, partial [Armatimonadetes bacterium]|nr:ISKra4 family transposase [Armatimonadota bacterium]
SKEATIIVVQADGKGVPLVKGTGAVNKVRLGKGEKRSKKKEAVVTSVYTIGPNKRSPEEVVASLFRKEKPETSTDKPSEWEKPQNKEIWATLDGKDAALERLASRVGKRQGEHITDRVALTDGAEALQDRVLLHLPGFTLILDFIHANEYLWDTANRLFKEKDPKREIWVEKRTLDLLSGHTEQVIADLRGLAQAPRTTKVQREELNKTANYFERNLGYMHYDEYLIKGWPIASGVIEGACRHLVKDRFELTGMRWTQEGAESLLQLRAVAENGDWDDYHTFRREQRHLRLYGSPRAPQESLERIALDSASQSSHEFVFPQTTRRQHKQSGAGAERTAA